MRSIFIIFALTLPLVAKTTTSTPTAPVPSCCHDPLEGQPDLFKRYDQILSVNAEFLYWSIAEGSLDYAIEMRQDAWGPTPSFAQGRFKNASYGVDPGFRIGFLFFRAPNFWEIRWQYTRMTSRGEDHAEKPDAPNQFLTGTFPHIFTNPLTGAHSRIHFNYNVFDWYVDRVFFPNPHLRLRVIGGATLAWMNQDWKVVYNDSKPDFTTIRNCWNFTGAGFKTGTMFDWYWTGNLYMTAKAFFGLLLGSYSNRAEQKTTFQRALGDNPAIPLRNTHYGDARPTMTGQIIFGPSYQKNFCSTRLELFAGFEMNMWLNLQEVYRSTQASAEVAKETWVNNSMLSLYGLTARISLDF